MPKRKKNRSESSRVCIKKKSVGVYVIKVDTGGEGKGGHRMYEK